MSIRSRPASLALVGIFLCGTACTSYKQIEPGSIGSNDIVLVILADETELRIGQSTLEADTLRGTQYYEFGRATRTKTVAIPLDQVAEFQQREFDPFETAGLVIGISVLVVAAAGIAWALTDPCLGLSC